MGPLAVSENAHGHSDIRCEENSKLVDITDEEMAETDAALAKSTPAGSYYPAIVPVLPRGA